jgi:type I restriction enzyme S subunit
MGEMFGFDLISNQAMNLLELNEGELAVNSLVDGDLLFGRRSLIEAGAGKCSLVVEPLSPLTFESSIIRVRLDKKLANPRFIYYYFKSPQGRGFISSIVSGTNVKGIRGSDLKNLPVAKPPKDSQDSIANCLSAYDDLIENNRRRMALLEQSTRLLYEEWFVRLRFPGHEHLQMADSSLGSIPKTWAVATLGDITTKLGSGATPRGGEASYQSEGITLIRSQNVYDNRFEDDGLAHISDTQADELANVSVEPCDILLNITGASVARCCMVPKRHLPARVNQHVMIIRTDPALASPYFVLAAINSEGRKRQLLSYARAGGTREALTKEMIANFQIVLPERELLQRFAVVAGDNHQQMEALANQNVALRAARDLLLPRLMSGEIDLQRWQSCGRRGPFARPSFA